MLYFRSSSALQTLYGPTATPGWYTPSQKPAAPVSQAPANLGYGRPAQNAAGQP